MCVAFGVLVYAAIVQPVVRQSRADAALQTTLRERRAEGAELASRMRALQQDLARVNQELADTPLRLEQPGRINQRLATVSEVASGCGVQIDRIQPGPRRRGPYFHTVPIAVSGLGTYPQCAVLLSSLHERFPDCGIDAFEMTATPGRRPGPATFRFELSWHTAPTDDAPAP